LQLNLPCAEVQAIEDTGYHPGLLDVLSFSHYGWQGNQGNIAGEAAGTKGPADKPAANTAEDEGAEDRAAWPRRKRFRLCENVRQAGGATSCISPKTLPVLELEVDESVEGLERLLAWLAASLCSSSTNEHPTSHELAFYKLSVIIQPRKGQDHDTTHPSRDNHTNPGGYQVLPAVGQLPDVPAGEQVVLHHEDPRVAVYAMGSTADEQEIQPAQGCVSMLSSTQAAGSEQYPSREPCPGKENLRCLNQLEADQKLPTAPGPPAAIHYESSMTFEASVHAVEALPPCSLDRPVRTVKRRLPGAGRQNSEEPPVVHIGRLAAGAATTTSKRLPAIVDHSSEIASNEIAVKTLMAGLRARLTVSSLDESEAYNNSEGRIALSAGPCTALAAAAIGSADNAAGYLAGSGSSVSMDVHLRWQDASSPKKASRLVTSIQAAGDTPLPRPLNPEALMGQAPHMSVLIPTQACCLVDLAAAVLLMVLEHTRGAAALRLLSPEVQTLLIQDIVPHVLSHPAVQRSSWEVLLPLLELAVAGAVRLKGFLEMQQQSPGPAVPPVQPTVVAKSVPGSVTAPEAAAAASSGGKAATAAVASRTAGKRLRGVDSRSITTGSELMTEQPPHNITGGPAAIQESGRGITHPSPPPPSPPLEEQLSHQLHVCSLLQAVIASMWVTAGAGAGAGAGTGAGAKKTDSIDICRPSSVNLSGSTSRDHEHSLGITMMTALSCHDEQEGGRDGPPPPPPTSAAENSTCVSACREEAVIRWYWLRGRVMEAREQVRISCPLCDELWHLN
jgi:hypothetical protein